MVLDPAELQNAREILYGSVKTIQHSAPPHFYNGMGPDGERLLLALMGGSVALIISLTLAILCCRRYKVSAVRRAKWSQHRQFMAMLQQRRGLYYPQLPLYYPHPAGYYYPNNLYQSAVHDPRMLDPGLNCVVNSAAITSSVPTWTATVTATLASRQSGGGVTMASSQNGDGGRDSLRQQRLLQPAAPRQLRQQPLREQRLPLIGTSEVV